ncbi:MAG: aquaporin [Oscillospiraceae bacterium]|nr:aquaporin [Oscillospiraceae bacterium]
MKNICAEVLGTAVLVFMGCGSAVVLGCDVGGGHLAVALAFGLSIVAAAYVIGGVSGCHINPAVSLAMLIDKRINMRTFIEYVCAQVAGAIIGAAFLRLFVAIGVTDQTGGLGSNGVAVGGLGWALLIEIILTYIFVLTILGVTADPSKGSVAGIVIGLTLTFVHIVGIPLTGTSVNPARSIGPAIFAGGAALADLWVFIVAPMLGAAGAALSYKYIKPTK